MQLVTTRTLQSLTTSKNIFLDAPEQSNDLDDVMDHCVLHILVQDHKEEHQDLVAYAHRLDNENDASDDDDTIGILAFREEIRDAHGQDGNEDGDEYNDDPVFTTPEKKGHPPEPPLDPGGGTGDGIKISAATPDYKRLGIFLLDYPEHIIKHTLSRTTQYARWLQSDNLKKMFRSPFPALNVTRRNEDVATDTVYADTPAIGGGETIA